jgi:hypothetical protein
MKQSYYFDYWSLFSLGLKNDAGNSGEKRILVTWFSQIIITYIKLHFTLHCNKKLPPLKTESRCVGLTTLPPSCADCLKYLGVSPSWIPKGLARRVMGLFYLLPSVQHGKCNIKLHRSTLYTICARKKPVQETKNRKIFIIKGMFF